ncbi:MAG: serine hydroxymethyltransferase [Candidatus Sungbacteria bacterium]|uniref:Serine hydroxymethyltransferase n=1 Tax=Candidatus Sungiibacteriota bacterium TaxID=2750080 RepID=A0A9D6LS61_9BACT|nr:serine hydroxymethyltransferase [Candidatus Sungbacteria bacterium]
MKHDKELEKLIAAEKYRQATTIDLIPSENLAPLAVREIVSSVLMNKYSEGYPGRRYYPGNAIIDQIELLAQNRAKKLFKLRGAWHVNVQPYSGSPANMAVYLGLLNFGDTILGMQLSAGGHLTHGHKVNFSGMAYKSVSYGVDSKTDLLDYNEILKIARRVKPKIIISGLTAYPRTIDFKKFGEIAADVRALHLADISHIAGLVAAGLHVSPFPYADVVTMTTHKILRGPRGAVIFAKSNLAEKINRAVFPGIQGGPHDNTTAAIAYTLKAAAEPRYKVYAKKVVANANVLAHALKKEGFSLVTGGTDNHLLLIDLSPLGMTGKDAETRLEKSSIIANRNTVPGDEKAFNPSGIRMGTPAVTTRGMGVRDMRQVAEWIRRAVIDKENPASISREIKSFLKKFPV